MRSEVKGTWGTGQRFPASEADSYSMSSVRAANGTVAVAWSRDGRGWVSTFAVGTSAAPTLLSASNGRYFEMTLDYEGRPLLVFSQDEPDAEGVDHSVRYLTATATRKLPVRRDLTGDGKADVLGLSTAGNLKLVSGAGLTKAPFVVPGWDPAAEVLPFGDLNGDRCNDVFVRLPGGEARMYTPVCGGLPSPGSAYKKIIGTGDLTGDGKADLLSRDTAGRPWLNAGNGTGAFGNRTAIGTKPIWDYTKIS